MTWFPPNTEINLVERFWKIDPITQAPTLTDPTTVTFRIYDEHGALVADYVSGVDPNVTNPSVGVFVCTIAAGTLDPDEYIYNVQGTGALNVQSEDKTLTVGSSATDPSDVRSGPCQPWINGADVIASTNENLGVDADHAFELDEAAEIGSYVMWALSGRIFSGVCEATVRPCQNGCGHWRGSAAAGSLLGWWWNGAGGLGAGWYNDYGDFCGCSPLSKVELAGFPVRAIEEVKIDGQVVDPTTYRIDERRDLVYVADAGPPVQGRYWPSCQDLRLPDTEPGTFSVRYTYGLEPPALGREAAEQVAAEIWKAGHGGACKLPAKATRVVRQGITIEKAIPFADLFRAGATGMLAVDLFIATTNPSGATRRPAIYTPGRRPPAHVDT